VRLPPGWWFDLNRGAWVEGNRVLAYAAALDELPLFVRDGAVLPYYAGPLHNSVMDLSAVELHLFCHDQPAQGDYLVDDRETRCYQTGAYGVASITAAIDGARLRIAIAETGAYPPDTVTFTPVLYGSPEVRELELTVNGRVTTQPLRAGEREWLCRTWAVQR
jgi:alpha-glucosidase